MDIREAKQVSLRDRVVHPWEQARFRVCRRLLAGTLPEFGRQPVNVLDLGCGDGYVARELGRFNPALRIHGVDPVLAELQDRSDWNSLETPANVTFATSLDRLPSATTIGLVLLLDVLEHVADDSGLLRDLAAKPFAAPEMGFLLTCPAYQSLFSDHDRFLGHQRRYTRRQLVRTAESAGLRVMDSGYFFLSLLLPRLLACAAEKCGLRKQQPESALLHWRHGSGITRLVAGVLLGDYFLGRGCRKIGIQLPGLSCYVICRKPGS